MIIRKIAVTLMLTVLITISFTLFEGVKAFAQGTGACAGDVQTFCSTVQPGQGRVVQCLKQNKELLSPGCKERILEVATQLVEVNQACEDDILWLCPGIQPGGGQIAKCLQANKTQLSPECTAAIAEVGN